MRRNWSIALLVLATLLVLGCGGGEGDEAVSRWIAPEWAGEGCEDRHEEPLITAEDMAGRAEAYARVDITPDLSVLDATRKQVLDELVAAGSIMNELFRVQATPCYDALAGAVADHGGEDRAALQRYFEINMGPWDRRMHHEPFIGGRERPEGANFYPTDMTRADRDRIAAGEAGLDDLFTMVRRDQNGDLVAVPYREFFGPGLAQAATHLRNAARLTENESLRAFLEARATAFETDDYYESDMLWMDLDSTVEVTIGPYEVYEDGLFGYKAAFEAFVTVTDPEQSAQLASYKDELSWLEANLPDRKSVV
jgi:hypothetical protein